MRSAFTYFNISLLGSFLLCFLKMYLRLFCSLVRNSWRTNR